MKFVVPLMIAVTAVISFASRSRDSGLMIGMPPPTEASYSSRTSCSAASASSSAPLFAITSLFAVTT